jgi:hypothetical protein
MNDRELGKREIEREHLELFLDAYQLATGETFSKMYDSETPDFIGRDEAGRIVGIEITQLRFSPDERHMHRIYPRESHEMDAWWRLLELMHQKDQKLPKGHWPQCDRKILVIMLVTLGLVLLRRQLRRTSQMSMASMRSGLPTIRKSRRSAPSICLPSRIPRSKVGSLPVTAAKSPSVEACLSSLSRGRGLNRRIVGRSGRALAESSEVLRTTS